MARGAAGTAGVGTDIVRANTNSKIMRVVILRPLSLCATGKNTNSQILGLDIDWFKFYDHLKFEICRKIAKSEKYKHFVLIYAKNTF